MLFNIIQILYEIVIKNPFMGPVNHNCSIFKATEDAPGHYERGLFVIGCFFNCMCFYVSGVDVFLLKFTTVDFSCDIH